VRRFFDALMRGLWGPTASRRKRALRWGAAACFVASIGLLITSLVLATQSGTPAKRPLPTGVVFNVPLAATAAVASPTPEPTASPTPVPVEATAAPTDSPTPEPTAPPTPEPTPSPSDASVVRLVIPKIGVKAPISVKGVDRNGVMQDPDGRFDVAYYNFTGRPGFGTGNNAVFAGHVDYYPHYQAVFWDLDKLKAGDEVHIQLEDGTDYSYRVTQMVVYNADNAPVDTIIGPTATESVTLITCNGTFASGHYNDRLVVRAERVTDQQPSQATNPSGG
jgi:LPXTG-site transpeptidase (sortase) family protein